MVRKSLQIVAGMLLGIGLGLGANPSAQGTLSNQVLQLLSRTNNWIGTNSFYDIRVPAGSVPAVTTDRIYTDPSHNLYFNGGLIAGAGGGVTPHNLLSATHPDTAANSPTRGAIIVGNATPAWGRLTVCSSGAFVGSDGTDTVCTTNGAGLTSLSASALSGTLPAISGVNLTNLNASNLASGTVPLARLVGITNTEISASASIVYSKLNLGGSILNADISAVAAIAYSKLALTGTIVNADISSSAAIDLSKLASSGAVTNQVMAYNGTSWAPATAATGSVTSVAMTVPSFLAVGGSPITTTGTLAVSLASQSQNLVFASPNGSSGTPTFRAIVNADLPLSGVGAGTYASVTVNTAGVITSATTTMNVGTQATGTLARANGGTGVTVSGDDTLLVGNGAAWAPQSLTTGPLVYNASTNAFANTLLWGGATTGSGFAGGVTDPSVNIAGTVMTTEYTLNSVTLPANAFNANTRGVRIQAWGTTAANGDAKTLTVYFGTAAIVTATGTSANGRDYYIDAFVLRTGGNTQAGSGLLHINNDTLLNAGSTSLAQTDSATIAITVKSANIAAAASSATGKGMLVTFIN